MNNLMCVELLSAGFEPGMGHEPEVLAPCKRGSKAKILCVVYIIEVEDSPIYSGRKTYGYNLEIGKE